MVFVLEGSDPANDGVSHCCPCCLPTADDLLQDSICAGEETLPASKRQRVHRIREDTVWNHKLVVRLLGGPVELVFDHLTGKSTASSSAVLCIGHILGPRPARIERQVPAEPLLGADLESIVEGRAAALREYDPVIQRIALPTGGKRSRAGRELVKVPPVKETHASAPEIGYSQTKRRHLLLKGQVPLLGIWVLDARVDSIH